MHPGLLHIPIPDPNNGYPVAVYGRGTSFLFKILRTLKHEMQAAGCLMQTKTKEIFNEHGDGHKFITNGRLIH